MPSGRNTTLTATARTAVQHWLICSTRKTTRKLSRTNKMRNRMLIWLLLGGGAFVLLAVTLLAVLVTYTGDGAGSEFAFSDRSIQVVDIEGELVDSRFIIDQLKRYEDSDSIKAILLNIDSPGGGV